MDHRRTDILLDSVLGAIGHTPLVELSRITRGLEGRILAKLEYLNPGFSKKDRIALQMIEEAEAAGELDRRAAAIPVAVARCRCGVLNHDHGKHSFHSSRRSAGRPGGVLGGGSQRPRA